MLLSICLASCGGSAAAPTPTPSPSAVQHASLTVDGLKRTYRVFRPPSLDPKKTVPLVLALHAIDTTVDTFASYTHLDDQAKSGGFIVAYPEGIDASWDAGGAYGASDKDVVFIRRLLDRLMSEFPIDTTRVFVAGYFVSAMMAYRLACELSDRIAAVASVSGTMAIDDCRPTRPVSILEMHGTNDHFIPYEGQASSPVSAIQRWVTLDGCAGNPTLSASGITKTSIWAPCREGTVVRLDSVVGGHSTWFGSASGPFADPVPGEPNGHSGDLGLF